MSYEFHPEAEEEFLLAINYYEERKTGLGHDFAKEVYSAIQSIIEHPTFSCPVRISLCGSVAKGSEAT